MHWKLLDKPTSLLNVALQKPTTRMTK